MQGRAGMNYQFIMEFLFKVMKKTWLLPPDLTEAKNTCDKEKSPHGRMDVIILPIIHIQRTKLLQSTALGVYIQFPIRLIFRYFISASC